MFVFLQADEQDYHLVDECAVKGQEESTLKFEDVDEVDEVEEELPEDCPTSPSDEYKVKSLVYVENNKNVMLIQEH